MWSTRIHCFSYSVASFNLETSNLSTLEIYLQLFIWLLLSHFYLFFISRDSILLIRRLKLLKYFSMLPLSQIFSFPFFFFLVFWKFFLTIYLRKIPHLYLLSTYDTLATIYIICRCSFWFSICFFYSFLFLFGRCNFYQIQVSEDNNYKYVVIVFLFFNSVFVLVYFGHSYWKVSPGFWYILVIIIFSTYKLV